ncbi:T9SS type A sorting domain-containing protein [Sediminitomix flava]|uniref:Putative secreted protein (Por secretion system target) n=1 Tax=Sediminitomix flava TaxID=379075 RepID=A0A315ZAW5_SEDFL|nr:T9SS type A sorting domain-containing protein [Sediminitomix flava]PWJ42691.1 putative secreted protein (Por secretion system target) [Sediminitomix flava]
MTTFKKYVLGILCTFFLIGIGSKESVSYAQACNLNAGGDQFYCLDLDEFNLVGNISAQVDTTSIQWTVVGSSSGMSILDPNVLSPTVVATAGNFPVGPHTFELSATCLNTGMLITDQVVITITPPASVATIFDMSNNIVGDSIDACRALQLIGSSPGSNETGVWSVVSQPNQHQFIQDGDTLNALNSGYGGCSEITYLYSISNGGCTTTDTVVVTHFLQDEANIINVGGIPVMNQDHISVCGDTVQVYGSLVDCSSLVSWQVTSNTPGVPTPNLGSQGSRSNVILFTQSGNYDLIYTVNSNGPCVGGSDTLNIDLCFADSITNTFVTNSVCEFPDSIPLQSDLDPSAIWTSTAGAIIINNGTANATAVITDTTRNFFQFLATETVNSCFDGIDSIQCLSMYRENWSRFGTFENDTDTLNIFCQSPGQFYRAQDYITNPTGFHGVNMVADSVPSAATQIIEGNSYYVSSNLSFDAEGRYIFTLSSNSACNDTMKWVVNVANIQMPSAGRDTVGVCITDIYPLEGSTPIDGLGNVNPAVDMTWTQVGGPAPVTFSGPTNQQDLDILSFPQVGTYFFEYAFARDEGCALADTIEITTIACDTVACPCFTTLNCCEYWDLFQTDNKKYNNEAILAEVNAYREKIAAKYKLKSTADVPCNVCDYPEEEIPVFVVDTCTSPVQLISTGDFTVSWSNNVGVNINPGYAIANEPLSIFVANADSSCVFSDSLYIQCCDDSELNPRIETFCTSCDPCEDPSVPLLVQVNSDQGPLSSSDYTFQWGGSFLGSGNGNSEQVYVNDTIWVKITDNETLCVSVDTFYYDCCNEILPPLDLSCEGTKEGHQLSWASVSNAQYYEVYITLNDKECCREGLPAQSLVPIQTTQSQLLVTDYDCFSWYVVAVCANGESSKASVKQCSCDIPCEGACDLAPKWSLDFVTVDCEYVFNGWNEGTNCPSQQYEWYFFDMNGNQLGPVQTGTTATYVGGSKKEEIEVCLLIYVEDANGDVICDEKYCSTETIFPCKTVGIGDDIFMEKQSVSNVLSVRHSPTPVSEELTFTFTKGASQETARLIIYNGNNEVILDKLISIESDYKLNVSALSPGLYFYQIVNADGQTEIQKILISR